MATDARELPYVDPNGFGGPMARAYSAFVRSPVGRFIAMKVATRVDPWLMRASRGRFALSLMLPSALLTTTGAKSGATRVNPVLYFHDGDDVILIASSFGRPSHPAWYHNLKANPRCRLGRSGEGPELIAEEVMDESERARLFACADRVYPGYADYRRRTDAVGRRIPVMRLRDAGAGAVEAA